MNFSSDIKRILKELCSSIDERGELSASIRGMIYRNIEKFSNHQSFLKGHYLRAKLELICARKVLENWESCELTDNSARELLDIAEYYLNNQGNIKYLEQLENRSSNLYEKAENIMCEGEQYFIAAYAAFSCVSAVGTLMYDVSFDCLGIPELEIDFDEWTAAFYASTSYCGGAVWEVGAGDDFKRRECRGMVS